MSDTTPPTVSPGAATVLDRDQHTLLVAPMVAFFRRHPDELLPMHTHSIMAVSLDFRAYPVTHSSKQVVEEIWTWLLNWNSRLVSKSWSELSVVQQMYLIDSNVLPFEIKSAQIMASRPADDFALVMTAGISWELS